MLCSVTECLAASVQRSQKQLSYPRGKGSRIGAERETGSMRGVAGVREIECTKERRTGCETKRGPGQNERGATDRLFDHSPAAKGRPQRRFWGRNTIADDY